MIFADTSAWYGLASPKDRHHKAAGQQAFAFDQHFRQFGAVETVP